MITPRPSRRQVGSLALVALSLAIPAATLAHAPDPALSSNKWAQDQVVPWTYRSGQVPPAWMAAAIGAAAIDSNLTRASRAAVFSKATSATSLIAYGEPTGCSALGIACFARYGSPTNFSMWFRSNGWIFDWGRLTWCQGPDGFVNGCFDVENVALDEFGHILSLGHHLNLPDQSDYTDAVVQTVSRSRPAAGWNTHAYGRCDVARLQLEYDRPTFSSLFSTCLKIPSTMTLAASAMNLWVGDSVRFSATLRTTTSSANRALADDPIAGRVVVLQRRLPGATIWTTIAPTTTYDWRTTFTPVGEGVLGASSAILRVTVSRCSGSPCVLRATQDPSGHGMER